MFDIVRNNKRFVQIFLGLITLPFAFFGIDSYVRHSGAGSDVASVGESKITVQQFDQALRDRQDQLRRSMGAEFKPEMMNSPEVRGAVLNSLIDQRLLLLEAGKSGLSTGDSALREAINAIGAFQEDGKFSRERYEQVLRAQGMSETQFEAKLRQDLTLQQLIGTIGDTGFVANAQAQAMLRIQSEEREFGEFRIAAAPFAAKVKIEADSVQKFYDENKPLFEVPERVKAEYLVLSLDALMAQTAVAEADVKAWYEAHKERYQQAEERRASHILVMVDATAADQNEAKSKAKAKAEAVLAEVGQSPGKFAELAKRHSQDEGSAGKGGDLGFFGRGMMVKPFEDAVFAMKEGEISEVLESDFGFHIVKLTGVKPARQRSLDEVRPEIEADLKRQEATKKFAEAAESFNNLVYEQADTLQPAAEKFKLKIQHSEWLPKTPAPESAAALGLFANAKLLTALFTDDALKNKRNTPVVEVASGTMVAARVVEHEPATIKPFDTVKADIEALLKAREMNALAKADGEARLASLKGGEDKLAWSPLKTVTRLQGRRYPPAMMQALFKADVQSLPAYVGAESGDGYVLYKIVKVNHPEKIDEERLKGLQAEYGGIVAQADLSAYLNGLRRRYKIDINKTLLENKERQ